MARKERKQESASSEQSEQSSGLSNAVAPEAATAAEAVPQAAPEPQAAVVSNEPKPEAKPKQPQKIGVRDAARRLIAGFQDHHWAGIKKYADYNNIGETATLEQCKQLFKSYGCKLK